MEPVDGTQSRTMSLHSNLVPPEGVWTTTATGTGPSDCQEESLSLSRRSPLKSNFSPNRLALNNEDTGRRKNRRMAAVAAAGGQDRTRATFLATTKNAETFQWTRWNFVNKICRHVFGKYSQGGSGWWWWSAKYVVCWSKILSSGSLCVALHEPRCFGTLVRWAEYWCLLYDPSLCGDDECT